MNNELKTMLESIIQEALKPIKEEMQTIKGEVQTLKGDMQTIKGEAQTIKSQVNENTQLLKAVIQRQEKRMLNWMPFPLMFISCTEKLTI
ncbi:hypothetical protein [Caldifermentibacillus hisashii]|uniref:hypothetical protein n=1 Tax=Caldifermentibacillus hisashii TaxID=996558 RepID=UPI003366BA04